MSSDIKKVRGQVRQIVQEIMDKVLSTELVGNVRKELADSQKSANDALNALVVAKLGNIESECATTLKKSDERARAVQGFLVQSAVSDLNNYVRNVHITMTAWEEEMCERFGGTDMDAFNKKIDERKKSVSARFQKEAEERMQADIAAKKTEQPVEESKPTDPAPEQPMPSAEKATA